MKRNTIITAIALLVTQAIATSCNEWLEVDSSANVQEELLFSDPEGYRTAVNGVYRLLSAPELYGQQLTWGAASVLGNNYDDTRLPGGQYYDVSYRELAAGDYESQYSLAWIDPIWMQGYRVIANCNNIIAYIEAESPDFFTRRDDERDMILGEMLGLRAMMHLDILRLFAPSAKADDGKPYIPYVTVFPERQPTHLTLPATLERVIADLERAKTLLAYSDTVRNDLSSTGARVQSNYVSDLAGIFFGVRGTRFNYFAASAILARAYQWRNAPGDMEKAYNAARDVYRFATEKTWFTYTSAGNLTASENNIHRKMPDDIIFALANNNMYALVANATVNATQSFFIKNDGYLFNGTFADDFRLNLINADKTSRRWTIPPGNQTGYPTADIIRYQGPLAPVVRLTEMGYIMCEHLSTVDLPAAITLLGQLRMARGSKTPVGNPSREDFLRELTLEMTREFLTEGQTFFLYKRLNQPIYNGLGNIDMTGRYTLPLPHSESAYIHL